MAGVLLLPVLICSPTCVAEPVATTGPYARQVDQQVRLLASGEAQRRVAAADALGFLRAQQATPALAERLRDESPDVRRSAALALAWCGGRDSVPPLLRALDDADWSVRQSAWVSLTNLTGMDFPFDALAKPRVRDKQLAAWRTWWASVPEGEVPA